MAFGTEFAMYMYMCSIKQPGSLVFLEFEKKDM
jgi:hypothetical protein